MTVALMTTSRLSSARACQRLHKLRYLDGYRSLVEVGNLKFGTLIHTGLEAWWKDDGSDRLGAALAAVAKVETTPIDRVRAEVLLGGYHARWIDYDCEVLAVEREFSVPMINPQTGAASRTWMLAGKIDAIIKRRVDGRILTVEHKTSSEDIAPGSDYWRRLRMDGQVSIYFQGARASGFDVQGCLYDVIGKPGIRPLLATPPESRKYLKTTGALYANQREQDETPDEFRKRLTETIAEAPERYYARGEVVRLETEIEDSMHDVWQISRQIREAEVAGRFPRNPDGCVRYGRTCEFFGVCTGEASLDDAALFKKETVVHPELTATENPKEEGSDATAEAAATT